MHDLSTELELTCTRLDRSLCVMEKILTTSTPPKQFKLEEISHKQLLIRHPCPSVKCFACFSSLSPVAVCLNLQMA